MGGYGRSPRRSKHPDSRDNEEVTSDNTALAEPLATWLQTRHQTVLVTIKKDGSPQSSNVAFDFDGTTAYVSVTATRAKTHNLRRDPRGLLHVLGEHFYQYASIPVRAELGAVSLEPGDQAGQDLLALYNSLSATPHPDPDDFFAAMVAERRLRLSLTPVGGYGMGIG
jgi:PPOX class probable F420-dependent enzyme